MSAPAKSEFLMKCRRSISMYALCCQRNYQDSYALVKGLTRENAAMEAHEDCTARF